MRVRTVILGVLSILAVACGDSCGCGSESGPSSSPTTSTGSFGSGSSAKTEGADAQSEPFDPLKAQLTPMPASREREAIETAAKEVVWSERLGAPVSPTALAAALPSRVHGFAAAEAAQSGQSNADAGTVSFASRRYTSGRKVMNLKVTDTAESPAMRKALEEQLLALGNEPTGDQRGGVIDGVPGIRAFHAAPRVSRAMGLIAGRFLVEVLVDDTDEAEDAWLAIETLDLRKVVASLPKSPSPPNAPQTP